MKCVHCENEWKVNEKNSATMTKCPFCGENPNEKEEKTSYENTKDALNAIYKKFGADVLLGEKLKSYFSDFAPSVSSGDKRLVYAVYEMGAAKVLKNNLNASKEDKEAAVKVAIQRLTEAHFSFDSAAEIIFEYVYALGWQIEKPKPEPTDAEKKIAEAEKKAAEAEKKAAKAEAEKKAAEETAKKAAEAVKKVTSTPSLSPTPVKPNPSPTPSHKILVNFVHIKGGTFLMGSPVNEHGRDKGETQHQVTVSSFYMCKFTVTQKEYMEVMGINPSEFKGDNLPVESVSWFDAVEYCNKLSQREGLTPAYIIDNNRTVTWNRNTNGSLETSGYRLPTEAEWEYACRAGTTTAYNTGSNLNDNTGWYKENSGGTTHPVGQKTSNAFGLFDKHGNVCEWCWDWYGNYPSGAQNDPTGAVSGIIRVDRGGCWGSSAECTRSAFRSGSDPDKRRSINGFRVVRS